jgi:hypothetical protein
MDHVAGSLHILLTKKEGRVWFNIIYLKLYQLQIITWWRLFILEYIWFGLCPVICPPGVLKKKSWSPEICI